jgi:hypothetical protein
MALLLSTPRMITQEEYSHSVIVSQRSPFTRIIRKPPGCPYTKTLIVAPTLPYRKRIDRHTSVQPRGGDLPERWWPAIGKWFFPCAILKGFSQVPATRRFLNVIERVASGRAKCRQVKTKILLSRGVRNRGRETHLPLEGATKIVAPRKKMPGF